MSDYLSKLKRSTVSAGSAAISSLVLLVSGCCIGPLAGVVALVGISGSTSLAIANVLGPFEPYLLGIAAVSLGIGFYSTYRSDAIECAEDQYCATPRGRKTERVLLWSAAAITVAFVFYRYIYPQLLF